MRYFRTLIISVLTSLSCSYVIMSFRVFSANGTMTGQDLIEEVVIAIVLGVAISVTSLIFRVERIPFLGQLLLHFFGILICVFTAGYFGNWYDVSNFATILFVLIATLVIYGGTWRIIQILTQKDIDELNKTIKKRRGEL